MEIDTSTALRLLRRFAIYGLIGLAVEVIYTGLSSLLAGDLSMHGFSFVVMFPIYGLAVLLEPLHSRISHHPWWVRGFTYLILIWSIEYISGAFLRLLIGACPWTYTDALNVNGYITLRMAPEWFIAGLVFERIHTFLDEHRI